MAFGSSPAKVSRRLRIRSARGRGSSTRARLAQCDWHAACSTTLRAVRAPALVALAFTLLAAAPADARMPAPTIKVESNRADLVSGGDALVRVTLPRGAKKSRLRLRAGSRNATSSLHRTGTRTLEGLVRKLPVGRVPLTARISGGSAARLYVTNHPIGGPVLAGPQIKPWTCQTGAKDAKCN